MDFQIFIFVFIKKSSLAMKYIPLYFVSLYHKFGKGLYECWIY